MIREKHLGLDEEGMGESLASRDVLKLWVSLKKALHDTHHFLFGEPFELFPRKSASLSRVVI